MGNSSSRLSRHDLEDLSDFVRVDVVALKKWQQKFLSEFPEGKLSKEQFRGTYAERFPFVDPDQVFKALDSDHDGFVDFREFMVGLCIAHNSPLEKKMEWAFKVYDADDNGFLEREEMESFVKNIYKALGREGEASKTMPGILGEADRVDLEGFKKVVHENADFQHVFRQYDGVLQKTG